MKTLYPHQEKVIEDVRGAIRSGHRKIVLAMPTGSGKTVVASHMIHGAAMKGTRSLFVVDRIELVSQAAAHLVAMGLQVGILQGENTFVRDTDEVIVASIQTIRTRGAPPTGFVIIDECHLLHQAHIDLMREWNAIRFIGLSATPLRPDLGKHFSRLVRGPSVGWLIENRFLTPVRAFCPHEADVRASLEQVGLSKGDYKSQELSSVMNRKELVGDIVSTWKRKADNHPTLAFAVDIAHSKSIVEDFVVAGIPAAHLDAYTDGPKRKRTVAAFRSGEIKVLSSVNVLGIGFDVPIASCGILARPTLSEALHMQQVGRLIRTAPGKDHALILDHAGNMVRFGLPQHFTVPDLGTGDRKTAKANRKERKQVVCASCEAVLEPGTRTCPVCGEDRPTAKSEITYADGTLVAYGQHNAKVRQLPTLDRRAWYGGFLWTALNRGYKPSWAFFAYRDKFKDAPPWEWRNMEPMKPSTEQIRWIRHYDIKCSYRRRGGRSKLATAIT